MEVIMQRLIRYVLLLILFFQPGYYQFQLLPMNKQ